MLSFVERWRVKYNAYLSFYFKIRTAISKYCFVYIIILNLFIINEYEIEFLIN